MAGQRRVRAHGRSVVVALFAVVLAVGQLLAVPLMRSPIGSTARAAATGARYFHGTADDQVNKLNGSPTATFDASAPTGTTAVTQTASWLANPATAGDPYAAYWTGAYSGPISGLMRIDWWWSTVNPEAAVIGDVIDVTIFADGASVVQKQVALANIGPTPKRYSTLIEVPATTVAGTLLVQAAGHYSDSSNGLLVHYDSTDTPSGFSFISVPPNTPSVAFDAADSVAFAPSTVVSAHWMGAEPQLTVERRTAASAPGRVDPKRIYVDWPLSTRVQSGQLSRSLDGGDSFRLLFDAACANRSRPNCLTGGGGDTEETVNLANGNLFFADQEALANEALVSSLDHGDTFPADRQHALTNVALVTDRQWLAATDGLDVRVGGKRVEAFLAYHGGPITTVGQYVQGILDDGSVVAQPGVGQIPGVAQSGPIRVDATAGPGRGWVYQSFYNGATGVKVATARADQYQDRNAWESNDVSSMIPKLMPWLQLDNGGNAYASWATDGIAWLSLSPIRDPRNDPSAGGRPGTFWTAPVRVSAPSIRSSVFVMNAAGDTGRVAIAYLGSEDCVTGTAPTTVSDNCQLEAHWKTYISVIDDALALAAGGQAHVHTGLVSHRVSHRGSVCTAGTTCTGDRSLLDLIDVGFDEQGRVGVVTMDNNNRLAAPTLTDNSKNGPFALFSKQVTGPSLSASQPTVAIAPASGSANDAGGDATWPNTATGTNLPSLDLKQARVYTVGDQLVAEFSVADLRAATRVRDLATYNATYATDLPAERLQYILRFATADDVFHMSMDSFADGSTRFFGGRLDANDGVQNGTGSVVGARYVADAGYTVSGSFLDDIVVMRAPLAAFGLRVGDPIYSATAVATAGPTEADATGQTMHAPSRTVDAAPPFDATLAPGTLPTRPVDCTAPEVTTSGGWQTLDDPRATNGTLCRVVAPKDGAAVMELRFTGAAVNVVYAKGVRGGSFQARVDDGPAVTVNEYQAPADPAKPDKSGRKELTFGYRVQLEAPGSGVHVLRITTLPPPVTAAGEPRRDMVYIDGFEIAAGAASPAPAGSTFDVSQIIKRDVVGITLDTFAVVVEQASPAVEFVVEIGDEGSAWLADLAGQRLGQVVRTVDGVAVVAGLRLAAGTYLLSIQHSATGTGPETIWEVVGQAR